MKLKFSRVLAAAGALALVAVGTSAQARDVFWSVGITSPGVAVGVGNAAVYAPAPVYVAPAPVYVAPRPVYVAPQPVYVAPPAYYVRPAPVYYTYYGDGYTHDHRHGKGRGHRPHHHHHR